MATRLRVHRRVTGVAGAPSALLSGEIAYNMVDGKLYIGYGDDGSGNATSVKPFAQDNFIANGDGEGGTVYSGGDGIDVTADVISIDAATFTGTWATTNIPSLDAGKITTGEFAIGRIPDLGAAKITSGEFDTARIPALDTAKITTGTFDDARIPDLDAAKVTTGVFDPARIPVMPSTVQITSSGGIANLTAGQQTEIGDGSVVTTTDGRRWVYTGSGSKTAEASYIELADITPEWAAISNKPAFSTVATSGSYNDLANRPTLGTMAAQNADSVAITGGTIDGVVLDGGTF